MAIHGPKPSEFALRLFGLKDADTDFYFEVDGIYFVRGVDGKLRRISKSEYNTNRLKLIK